MMDRSRGIKIITSPLIIITMGRDLEIEVKVKIEVKGNVYLELDAMIW